MSYFDLLPDGLRADGEMFLLPEALNKAREQMRIAREAEEVRLRAARLEQEHHKAEKRAAEMRAAEQANEEKRYILDNGRKLIIGSWRDEDNITSFNADGTRLSKTDKGDTMQGTWSLDGDILTSVRSLLNAERAPATIRVQLLQLKADKLVIKEQDGKEWHAVRIK